MKTINDYKQAYKKAKTTATKSRVVNAAMLNLPETDKTDFLKWQVNYIHNS